MFSFAAPTQAIVSRKYGGPSGTTGLGVEAPILAQVFARLGAAYDAFESARVVVETPFPFPWHQVRTCHQHLIMVMLRVIMLLRVFGASQVV